jgi:hypothetical protein
MKLFMGTLILTMAFAQSSFAQTSQANAKSAQKIYCELQVSKDTDQSVFNFNDLKIQSSAETDVMTAPGGLVPTAELKTGSPTIFINASSLTADAIQIEVVDTSTHVQMTAVGPQHASVSYAHDGTTYTANCSIK